ncbi:hypothetical protein BH23BAC1_BH23BAC1_23660 [soil metagenome]
MAKYFLIIFFCFLSGQVLCADYFISNQGNDADPGTSKKPWKSIAHANTIAFKAGDRIFFKGGDNFEGNFILNEQSVSKPSNPITIGSYGNGSASILAGTKDGILVKNRSGIVVQDLLVIGSDRTLNQGYGVKIINEEPGQGKLEFVRIKNVEAKGFRWAGIFVGGIPTDLPGVIAPEGSKYGFKDVIIENCRAHDNMYYGIYITAAWNSQSKEYGNEEVKIIKCIAYENPGDPLYTANHSGSGIMVDDTDTGLIEHCISYSNGALNAGLTGGPCGIWTHFSTQMIIQYCESYQNKTNGAADGGGFDLDGGVSNSTIQYCYSHDNDGPGFLMWNYEGAPLQLANNIIRYNISANDSRKHTYGAIHIGNSGPPIKNIQVYNNTFYISESKEGNPMGIWTGGKVPNENFQFLNNIFITEGNVPLAQIGSNEKKFVFAANAFWNKKGFSLNYKNTLFNDFQSWIQDASQEHVLNNNLFTDPALSSMESIIVGFSRPLDALTSFQLPENSPLINAGQKLSGDRIEKAEKDFWGNELPENRISIGAHQR